MHSKAQLLHEIDQIPDFLIEEVFDFVQLLKSRHGQNKLEISVMSESVLAKDWLRPEEDAAWQDL
jgi:hypothetical protein